MIVDAEATMSNLPCATSVKIVSNAVSWYFDVDAEFFGDGVDQVDVETVVVRGLAELERRVRGVGADGQSAVGDQFGLKELRPTVSPESLLLSSSLSPQARQDEG